MRAKCTHITTAQRINGLLGSTPSELREKLKLYRFGPVIIRACKDDKINLTISMHTEYTRGINLILRVNVEDRR